MTTGQEAFTLTVNVQKPLVPNDAWGLPEFGDDHSCEKCGSDNVITAYHCDVANWKPCYEIWRERSQDAQIMASSWRTFPEHMDKKCTRCGYEWTEGVL